MQTISPPLAAHLAGEVTAYAHCWKLTRRDGVMLGFTDLDRDLVVDGVTYIAASGISPSAVSASTAMKVDELDMEGLLDSSAIETQDILDGKYDYAEVILFLVRYDAPEEGILILRTGWLGEVTLKGQQFVAEIRGLTQALQQPVGEIFSATCRANFADTRCGLSAASFTVTGTVTQAEDLYSFADSTRTETDGYFAFGKVTFTSGAHVGLTVLIKEFVEGRFYTALPLPAAPAVGDSYQALAGCDKLHTTCLHRFNNIVRFRGEPYVPGTDKLLETAATRSNWS